MKAIAFDTLSYANKLLAAGFTKQQPEVQAETLAELVNENLATNRDLAELKNELIFEIGQAENRVIIKVGAMIAASIAITATLIKLL